MADRSFALAPALTGFDRYASLVGYLLSIHERVRDALYDPDNSGGDSKTDIDNALKVLANLTDTGASGPTGYNIDPLGKTQNALLPDFTKSWGFVTLEQARRHADFIIIDAASALQSHLVDLIEESTSYSDINDYYSQNQIERSSVANVLNGGYHFTAEWNRISTRAGVPYDSTYDID